MSKYNILDIPCVWRKTQDNMTAREIREFMRGVNEAIKLRKLSEWVVETGLPRDSTRALVNKYHSTELMTDKELERFAIEQFKLPKASTGLRLDKSVTDWLKSEYGLVVKNREITRDSRGKSLGERESEEGERWSILNTIPILAAPKPIINSKSIHRMSILAD